MFEYCTSLETLPNISIWNTSSLKDISYMFNNCTSLICIPDKSIWDTNSVEKMEHIFDHCNSLFKLPNIRNWDITDLKDIKAVFSISNSDTINKSSSMSKSIMTQSNIYSNKDNNYQREDSSQNKYYEYNVLPYINYEFEMKNEYNNNPYDDF